MRMYGLVHCRTEQEAEAVKAELQARLEECHLQMHPTKTKIVYCRDGRRRASYPNGHSLAVRTGWPAAGSPPSCQPQPGAQGRVRRHRMLYLRSACRPPSWAAGGLLPQGRALHRRSGRSRAGCRAHRVKFDFLGYEFRPRRVRNPQNGRTFCGLSPAVSPSALKAMRETIRDLNIRQQTQLALADVAE